MTSAHPVIDFEPAHVSQVARRSGYVAVVLPSQPCYSRAAGDRPRIVPLYFCEMRVWGGVIEVATKESFQTEEWELEFPGGSRSCFLPIGLEVAGPIKLSFQLEQDPLLVVTGNRFSLEVGAQVGTSEQWPAT